MGVYSTLPPPPSPYLLSTMVFPVSCISLKMWHLYFYISCLILKASFHTSPRLSSTVKYVQRFFFFKIKHYTYEITQFPFMEILFSIYGNDATVIMHLDWFLMLTSCILWLIVEVTFYTADVLLKFSTVYLLSANWGILIK